VFINNGLDLNLLQAVNLSNVLPGIHYNYYEGVWSKLPNFATLSSESSGILSNINLSFDFADDNFGLEFIGFIDAPEDGLYRFYLLSDDGSALYIDNNLVIDNDGLHASQEKSGIIGLEAGLHTIRVSYFEKSQDEVLQLMWEGPSFEKQLVPDDKFFHEVTAPTARSLTMSKETGVERADKTTSLIEKENSILKVTVYPNPFIGQKINLSIENAVEEEISVGIYDLKGRILHKDYHSLKKGHNLIEMSRDKWDFRLNNLMIRIYSPSYGWGNFLIIQE
jgi:hypothetical protein